MRIHWFYISIRLFSFMADIFVCKYAKGLNLQEEENDIVEVEKATAQESIVLKIIPE